MRTGGIIEMEEMMYKNLGRRVRQQRELAKLTQDELAEMANISLSFLGHIERGTRKASLDTVVRLSNALNVSPNILLQDSLNANLLDIKLPVNEEKRIMLREITNRILEYTEHDFRY